MSGICALINFAGEPADISLLARMMAAGAHRGPDGSHTVVEGSAALGHLALEVSEPVGPRQPLLRSGLCLSADVRLDNREDLIARLQRHGHDEVGAHSSDAELLLAAYQCWGEECPAYLLGDFAFALWDARLQRLFCARDPLGIKPLCHARTGSSVCVASEAQQILAHPGVSSDLDEISVGRHLMGWHEPLDRTFFRAVRPVPPATKMVFDQEGQSARMFWSIQEKPDFSFRREDDAAACLLDILQQAVSARLRSRGPVVGVSLSGGLDSSSVAALARQALLPSDRALVGLTYTFDQLTECDEREHVRALAEKIDIESVLIDAELHWFLGDSEAFTPDLESPFLGWESSYRAMLGELTARRGRILLTGHGADDLLGGSINVYADRFWTGDFTALTETVRLAPERALSPIRALHRYLVRPIVPPRPGPDAETPRWISSAFSRRANLPDLLKTPGWRRPGRLAEDEVRERTLEERGYLRAVQWHDRRASGFGIEPRHPFLDRRLLELALTLPSRLLFRIGSRKPLLQHALRGLLPESLRTRRDKTRFGQFLDLSLRDKAGAKIGSLLEAPLSADLQILDAGQLRTAYRVYRTGQNIQSAHLLWNAVTLELWLRRHQHRHSAQSRPILPAPPALADRAFGGERIAS